MGEAATRTDAGTVTPQRRGRRIAMTADEVDEFLTRMRVCRVATVDGDGAPQVEPLWFVWDGQALWLNSVVRSQRFTNLMRDPRIAIVADAGHDYQQLHGVRLMGTVETVGEVPRSGEQNAELESVEQEFSSKYFDGEGSPIDGRHAWVRLVPDKVVSWDFRKLGDMAGA